MLRGRVTEEEWIIQPERGKIHRRRQIPSVLQIQREITTAEGQDRDFNTDPKGTESAALSHSKKHNYYLTAPERRTKKKKKDKA